MPLTVYARSIFRDVCQASYDWDDALPLALVHNWSVFATRLPIIANIRIPRFLDLHASAISLVGFADASEKAYAAVLYLVSHHPDRTTVRLLIAKARVAPVKAVTLPRLELCAAQLLSRSIKLVTPLLPQLSRDKIFAFSDSTIALSWITAEPIPHWKVFVGNRVADILEQVPRERWFHIPSVHNPADCASRGLKPDDVACHRLWWAGPDWLSQPIANWPVNRFCPDIRQPSIASEIRSHVLNPPMTGLTALMDSLEERFSSLTRLQHTVAWCCRFAHNARHPHDKWTGPLKTHERQHALLALVRRAQAQDLGLELADCQKDKPRLHVSRQLSLFIDPRGTLRVGGRLHHADVPENARHPILLPPKHPLTRLVIAQAHISNLHVGPAATLAYLRNNYWILNGRNVVRRQLSKCNRCFSVKPQPFQPPMGQLPAERTTAVSPFTNTGVDYAGPFFVKLATLRSVKVMEMYLAVFVCFMSKAVHLEVVSDLSTPAFLAAYRRFVARRGHPAKMWSDNGRNFLGAANELRRLAALLASPSHQSAVLVETASNSTTWQFIPPSAPHFGGLWEAAVKSAKRLLKTTIGAQIPTLETFMTISTQVEAILNSRPLTAMSSSPDDLQVLTPGHFLIFRPLTAPPSDQTLTERSALRSKWATAQFIVNQFWRRWTKEYLLQEQRSAKWNTSTSPATVGQIVLLMEDNLAPLQWAIGRISRVYPGEDGVIRVADVRTSSGQLRRPVHKLCPLPTQ